MANKEIEMEVARAILEYLLDRRLSKREAARAAGVDRNVVTKVLHRYQKAGLGWPIPYGLSDEELRALIYPYRNGPSVAHTIRFDTLHLSMQQKGATLTVLHQEWVDEDPEHNNLKYSQFCKLYREYREQLQISMRRVDPFGEVCYVDYSGMTVSYFNRDTMQEIECQIFIGVLGGSQYTFCEATHTQRIPDWIGSHTRMFTFFGGVPRTTVFDNLKSAVTKADRFFPEINRSYKAMCRHYGTIPFAARARKPKDKPKAEAGVLLAQRWILFALRKRRFFSLAELNDEIAVLLARLNDRKFQKKSGSRRLRWVEHERLALKPLPLEPYVLAEWGKARVGRDYHVEIEHNFYSVPNRFRNTEVDFRLTEDTVELLQSGSSIACHARSYDKEAVFTKEEHQPPNHRAVASWTSEDALKWASSIGRNTEIMLSIQLKRSPNFLSGYRTTEGMKRLCKSYGDKRLEEVCSYAVENGVTSMDALRTILSKRIDSLLPQGVADSAASKVEHENLRGANYYTEILTAFKEQDHDE